MDKQAEYNELQATQRKLWAAHQADHTAAIQGRKDYATATDAAVVKARKSYLDWKKSYDAQIACGCSK